jgi:hypothetical protein
MLNIPALEWDKKTTDGASSIGSATITGVSDTSEVLAGMVIVSSAFPFKTTVLSKTANTIVLSATATAVALSFDFYKRYDFQYPPTKDEGEQYKANQTKVKTISGAIQTVTNYVEATRALTFGFVSKTDRDNLRDSFYVAWALLGKSFRYFEDQDINTVINYENNTLDYRQKRQVKKHPDYLYELDFNFRRVI